MMLLAAATGMVALGVVTLAGCSGVGSQSYGESKPQPVDYNQSFASSTDNSRPAMSNPDEQSTGGGVKVALGTDSGTPDTYPGYFELRELALMGETGMAPGDVIKAATSTPARA